MAEARRAGLAGPGSRFLFLAAALLLHSAAVAAGRWQNNQLTLTACQSEAQIHMCGRMGLDNPEELVACCERYNVRAGGGPPKSAAVLVGGGSSADDDEDLIQGSVSRPDLDFNGEIFKGQLDYHYGTCTPKLTTDVPIFYRGPDGSTQVRLEAQAVPELRSDVIAAVKERALASAPRWQRRRVRALRETSDSRRAWLGKLSGFLHPGGYVGPAEIAHMQSRLAMGSELKVAARERLLKAREEKKYGIEIPVSASPDGYGGPYPTPTFQADYYGFVRNTSTCPPNYPEGAPTNLCSHISLVEIDAPMTYRHAVAYAATGDERHADQAVKIVEAWATVNKDFGPEDRNGPLEAAWSCSPMARSMDLLRATWPGFKQETLDTFMTWVDGVLMPQMDWYVDVATVEAVKSGRKTTYGNWHASVADCMMAVGVLADDRARYKKGLQLYRTTVQEYFKWGRGYAEGRVLGEATETLRDIYHTLFGMGSLIQAAETAWGQNDDVYSEANHVLAAAMEVHARIINAEAAKDETALPPRFKFKDSMPDAPANCSWKWDFESQHWASYDANKTKCSDLNDGFKYAIGIRYLPNGFELGYNHFVGRLGMKLPETAKLLAANPVDWFTFSWGLATLTHADSAKELWRAGLRKSTLCRKQQQQQEQVAEVKAPQVSVSPLGGVSIGPPSVTVSPGALLEILSGGLGGATPVPDAGILAFGHAGHHHGRGSIISSVEGENVESAENAAARGGGVSDGSSGAISIGGGLGLGKGGLVIGGLEILGKGKADIFRGAIPSIPIPSLPLPLPLPLQIAA